MRSLVLALAVGMLFVSDAAAEEPNVFHTAHFNDDTVVSLGLVSNQAAQRPGYDFDVLISLSSKHDTDGTIYNDPGKHRALVRCGDPARVSVRGVDYPVRTSDPGSPGDWKADLWRAVCVFPVS
ncbi:hypothetical protein AC244_24535 [Ensifer adhaerens]|uniref:Lipoprotein n=1 Tax=Ensifer adhaerens TaxID=106592 RepID=A0A0L8BKZ3_ENSAD|nr:hypothetical protein [Ensifer adhaerens]KOF15238.1 hypothetical protein AC244_24535 [Ensifer adhaerens]